MTKSTGIRALLACAASILALSAASAQDRNAYFGEQHIHTSWSVDAWLFGNHMTGPDAALKYGQGEAIKHPLGYDIKIEQPLDWMGVTDHSEYVGITKEANTPGSAVSKMPEAQPLILKNPNDPADVAKVFAYLVSLVSKPPIKAFMSPEVAGSIWKQNVKIADENNKPGTFTAFCSYEFTSQFNFRNLHRNVYFRDCAKVADQPFSSLDSWHPEDLWKWMDTQRAAGNELLAISHNANLSDGWMYPIDVDSLGRPIDAAWAASRDRNERLIEMKQIKGQSETHPLLSPNDEFANYEISSFLIGLPERFRPDPRDRRLLCAPGPEGRPHDAGRPGLQPLQVRLRRRLRFPQFRRPLPPEQLLRRPWHQRRHHRDPHGRPHLHRLGRTVGKPGGPLGRLGGGEHARLASGTRCTARRPMRRAAPASRSASSAAGTTRTTSSPTRTG